MFRLPYAKCTVRRYSGNGITTVVAIINAAIACFPVNKSHHAVRDTARQSLKILPRHSERHACHIGKNAKHWSRKQVELIIYYLGEP